ncbi:MAG TPA: HIT family protein [Ruminiclostridium sp.]|nr:HIT family protein [Ruminiclostridium sp.]
MKSAEPCMYCQEDNRLCELMLKVAKLDTSTVYLYRETSYPGRCVLAVNRHVHKLTELSEEERNGLFREVTLVAGAIISLYGPQHMNYLILGDKSPHLHVHLVPKYQDGKDWGSVFQMMPSPSKFLEDQEYSRQIALLRQELMGS